MTSRLRFFLSSATVLLAASALTTNAFSDGAIRDLDASGAPIHASPPDPAIAQPSARSLPVRFSIR